MFDDFTLDPIERRSDAGLCSAGDPAPRCSIDIRGIRLIADTGHSSLASLDLARSPGRRIAVMSAAGERRHADLQALGLRTSLAFDAVVVYENAAAGSLPGSSARLILEGARQADAPHHQRHCKLDIVNALRFGLGLCHPGDVLVFSCASLDQLVVTLSACEPAAASALA